MSARAYIATMSAELLYDAIVNGEQQSPRLTWYDDASGERIELSGRTLTNWVAKAANWLQVEAALEPGETLGLMVPASHWRAGYWALAAWSQGLLVVTDVTAPGLAAADTVVGLDDDPAAASADLVEPAASLAASPLQAMPDAMPPFTGGTGDPTWASASAGSAGRVLVDATKGIESLRCVAQVITAGGSVVLVRNADPAQYDRRVLIEQITATA